MKDSLPSLVAVAMAIVGIALLSVIVSNKSDSQNVITKLGSNFARAIRCAAGPVLGGGSDCAYPANGVATSTITYGNPV